MSQSLLSQLSFRARWRVLAVLSLVAVLLPLSPAGAHIAHADTTTQIPCATNSDGSSHYFNSDNPYLCTITTTVHADGTEDVRIDEPVVDQSSFEYKAIVFSPNDRVTLTADGCVQTGGLGDTWKRYVDPSGSDSGFPDGFYYGTISIPGATTATGQVQADPNGLALVSLSPYSNAGAQIFVPGIATYPGSRSLDLTLGYMDEQGDYGDNGYWSHDNGNNDQCAYTDANAPLGQYGGNAWVNLHIVHDQSNPFGSTPPHNWDLVPNGLDPNGLAANAEWGWQRNGGFITNQGLFDPSSFDTQQPTTRDTPTQSVLNVAQHILTNVCDLDTGLSGHRNWFDVTYNGTVDWVEKSGTLTGDDDYNMRVQTTALHADPEGTTFYNDPVFSDGGESSIGLEYDSDETIDNFDQSPEWKLLHQMVDTGDDTLAGTFINGQQVVVTGLMGIDEMHQPHAEVHPVHAIAFRDGNPSMSNDNWMFFVRNWGDEGECSSKQHYLLDQQITIQIPPLPGLASPRAHLNSDTQVFGTGAGSTYDFYSGPEGTFVTFHLPPGSSQGFAFGSLDLNWMTGSMAQARRAARVGMAKHRAWLSQLLHKARTSNKTRRLSPAPEIRPLNEPPGDPEARLAEIWPNMTTAQQQTAMGLYTTLSPPQIIVSSGLQPQIQSNPPPRPSSVPGVAEGDAIAKLQRDAARFEALCAATGASLPTQPTWCSAMNLPPVTVLTTSGGTPGKNGWTVGPPVTATLHAYDASGFGIAATEYSFDNQTWVPYTGPFTLPDGAYTLYYRSRESNGTVEDTRQQAFKIDVTPPTISITSPTSGPYIVGQTIQALYSCTDATSGVANCTGPVANTTSFPAGALGSHDFIVNAADNAGNTASKTVTYTVQYGVQLLYKPPFMGNSGSTIPIKLALQAYVNGVLTNVSSSSLPMQALCVVPSGTTTCGSSPTIDYRNQTPQNFAFSSKFDQGSGYQFNVQTTKSMAGAYLLLFRVAGEGNTTYHADANASFALTK